MVHPGFLDQPFVKVPNPHPNDDIDFRAGEVIYENPKVSDWVRLSYVGGFNFFAYFGLFWPVASLYKTHICSPEMRLGIYSQYQDFSSMSIDKFSTLVLIIPAFLSFQLYILLKIFNKISRMFVSKLQYNRSKDLLFVTYMNELGSVTEKAFEVANIEHVTPSDKAGLHWMSATQKGGFMHLKNLQNKENFFCNLISLKYIFVF